MISLTEPAAELLIADRAFAPGPPGFVGLAVDLLLDRPGLPASLVDSLAERPPLRHGFATARSAWVVVVSGAGHGHARRRAAGAHVPRVEPVGARSPADGHRPGTCGRCGRPSRPAAISSSTSPTGSPAPAGGCRSP